MMTILLLQNRRCSGREKYGYVTIGRYTDVNDAAYINPR